MIELLHVPLRLMSMLIRKGPIYLLYFVASYVYLTIYHLIWKRRQDVYDLSARGQPEKTGFFIPKQEWQFDTPQNNANLKKFSDGAFIYGANSKSEYLAVHVSRITENEVKCSLILRLHDGKVYVLPKEHTIQRSTSEANTFGSSRLKLQCLLPLRQWRFFFNGILEEYSNEEEGGPKTYKHFKLTFLWKPSSVVFDFSTDMSKSIMSQSVASTKSWFSFPFHLNRIKSIFDSYEQPGMLLGTIQIEKNPESEMYLWGPRGRSMGKITDLKDGHYSEIYGIFKNGTLIHVGILNVPGLFNRFIYGYVMRSDGFIHPIDEFSCSTKNLTHKSFVIRCSAGSQRYKINVDCMEGKGIKFQREFDGPSSVEITKLTMNEKSEGKGFLFKGIIMQSQRSSTKNTMQSSFSQPILPATSLLTVPFKNEPCQLSELCGGKGSSLGKLFALSNQRNTNTTYPKFVVPDGIVVTTKAYQVFIKGNLLQILRNFETEVWSKEEADIKPLCENIVKQVSETKLPDPIKNSIASDLKDKFGDKLSDHIFAVRSSATGEDTEQMSAAGQMETFLGIKSVDKIFDAVVKCWASQFTFQAVQYKRQYGQRLNTPMAVVIQEMVPCDVAGVLFTCDPITGNPSFISITANWGLGESVVSASSEPDTITLGRDVNNQLQYLSEVIGKKQTKIVIDGPLGTKEVKIEDDVASRCCISKTEALRLGQVALKVEEYYGTARDIEWGIRNGMIYLFQSRPVTSLDIETEFETEHASDTALQCEMEIITRAHVGEAIPGAFSPLSQDFMCKQFKVVDSRLFQSLDGGEGPEIPYLYKGFAVAYHQLFFPLISGFFKFSGDENVTNAFLIAFFGRIIDDKEIRPLAEERHSGPKEIKMKIKDMILPFHVIFMSFFSGVFLRRSMRRFKDFNYPIKDTDSSFDMIWSIGRTFDGPLESMCVHLNCSFGSTHWNSSILSLLATAAGGFNNDVYSDFAYLLSTCTEVESADVPASIEDLAYEISKTIEPATFKKMDVEKALKWLQNSQTEATKKYKKFMERHGHRCVKEFDVFYKVWSEDPEPLVKSLQEIVSENMQKPTSKKSDSFLVILSKLKVKLNFYQKLKLFWLLPNARSAVGERERSKAFLIDMYYRLRVAFNRTAKQMVLEGRIPRKEYFYFLYIDEIEQLCKSRAPRLVAKAARRWKCFKDMEKLLFPEIIHGIPKPENYDEPIPTGKGFMMTGVPVSQGIVKAKARVVRNISEASTIKAGEILITYSTDIAWSPYFPLLVGVVTELGGLISHGAVVAREYGLPCVVNLHGATRAFKSGELVILDGNKGTLQKVDED